MSHYYENVVNNYFEYKRNEIQIKKIERQIKEEKDVLEKELLNISKQELFFKRADYATTSKRSY